MKAKASRVDSNALAAKLAKAAGKRGKTAVELREQLHVTRQQAYRALGVAREKGLLEMVGPRNAAKYRVPGAKS